MHPVVMENLEDYLADALQPAALREFEAHLKACGYELLDIQQWTEHTGSMGAIEISRAEYLRRLARAVELPARFTGNLDDAASSSATKVP